MNVVKIRRLSDDAILGAHRHVRPRERMTQEHGKERNKIPNDRRAGRDRRKVDKPPPGGRERRVSIEPRKPEVLEFEVTPSDWAALQDQLPPGSGRGGPAVKD